MLPGKEKEIVNIPEETHQCFIDNQMNKFVIIKFYDDNLNHIGFVDNFKTKDEALKKANELKEICLFSIYNMGSMFVCDEWPNNYLNSPLTCIDIGRVTRGGLVSVSEVGEKYTELSEELTKLLPLNYERDGQANTKSMFLIN